METRHQTSKQWVETRLSWDALTYEYSRTDVSTIANTVWNRVLILRREYFILEPDVRIICIYIILILMLRMLISDINYFLW